MLNTIRAKFAAVLLAGLVLTILALSKGISSGFGEPALIASSLMLVVMLLVERIVINPITRLTRDVVLIAKGDPSDPMNRLALQL